MVYILFEVIPMSVSKKVKALLMEREKKQSDLMDVLEMSSKQSLSNKFSNERWSAEDLIKIAEFCDVFEVLIELGGGHLVQILTSFRKRLFTPALHLYNTP